VKEKNKHEKESLVLKECTCLLVEVYLQKASLKAAGLLSSDKAMVISGENHLKCNRSIDGKQKKAKENKGKER